jgi:phosphate transport system permease protein
MNGRRRFVAEAVAKTFMVTSSAVVMGTLVLILGTIFVKGFAACLSHADQDPEGYYSAAAAASPTPFSGSLVLGIGRPFLALLVSLPIVSYLNVVLRKSPAGCSWSFRPRRAVGHPSDRLRRLRPTLMVVLGMKASLLAGTVTVAILIIPIMAAAWTRCSRWCPRS